MSRYRVFAQLCAVLALSLLAACTPAQDQVITSGITTGCTVATAAEAADPAFTKHNGKIVNGVAVLCTTAPVLVSLIPPPSTPTPPATTTP
jgi:hypothetical protein